MTETAEMLDAVERFTRRFVVLPGDHEATAVALFVAHTWAIDAAFQTPYIVVLSPEKRSGKTRLLEVLELLVRQPWRLAAASEAALFRKLDQDRPTILLDEIDALFGSSSERTEPQRAILNAGNRRGSTISRCVMHGAEARVQDFDVFGPKVLAGIDTGKLPDTIKDRGVVIAMKRRTALEPVERFRVRLADEDAAGLRDHLEDWADRHAERLHAVMPDLPNDLNDRAAEAWEALFAIADLAGDGWPAKARAAARALVVEDDDEVGHGLRLLAATRVLLDGKTVMSSADLVQAINRDDELPYGGWSDGKGINQRDLAKYLKPFAIKPRTVRLGVGTARGYHREQFEEPWARYLPEATQATHSAAHGNGDVSDVSDVSLVAGYGGAPRQLALTNGAAARPEDHRDPDDGRHDEDDDLADLDVERAEALVDRFRGALEAPPCRCERPFPARDEDGRHCAQCRSQLRLGEEVAP